MNPVNPDQKIYFLLSFQGDSISLTDNQYLIIDIEKNNIHPKLKETVTLKTHYAVLKFLLSIQSNEECINSIELYRHSDPTSLNYSVARFIQSILGLPKVVVDPCPIEEMINFVKSQVNILNLESIEEIIQYLDDNPPQTEYSYNGALNLEFEGYTITLNDLIQLFQKMLTTINEHENPNSYHSLLDKINSFYENFEEKEKEWNLVTRNLIQKKRQVISKALQEIKFRQNGISVKRVKT